MALGTDGVVDASRGNEPATWTHATMTPSITFTWHHTIPWNSLRSVWNGLVQGRHWDAVDQYLQIIGAANVSTIIGQLKAGNLADRDELHTKLTWQGWNIVEGPGGEYRTDDPGEEFDAWPTKAMSNNQRSTYLAVQSLYQVMKVFPSTAAASAQDAKKVQKALEGARSTLRGREPMPWNEGMWTVVTPGRVDKSKPGVWATKPQWKRAAD